MLEWPVVFLRLAFWCWPRCGSKWWIRTYQDEPTPISLNGSAWQNDQLWFWVHWLFSTDAEFGKAISAAVHPESVCARSNSIRLGHFNEKPEQQDWNQRCPSRCPWASQDSHGGLRDPWSNGSRFAWPTRPSCWGIVFDICWGQDGPGVSWCYDSYDSYDHCQDWFVPRSWKKEQAGKQIKQWRKKFVVGVATWRCSLWAWMIYHSRLLAKSKLTQVVKTWSKQLKKPYCNLYPSDGWSSRFILGRRLTFNSAWLFNHYREKH